MSSLIIGPVDYLYLCLRCNCEQIENSKSNWKILVKQSVAGTGPKFEDLYHLLIEFRNRKGEVVHRVDEGQVTVAEEWRNIVVEHEVSGTSATSVAEVVITERAKDVEYWAGHFGTKVKPPVIMILYGDGSESSDSNGKGTNSKNNGPVSIVQSLKRRSGDKIVNGYRYGCDTYFHLKTSIQSKSDDEEQKTGDSGNSSSMFWCNTFNVGYGKQWVDPTLDEIGVLGKCVVGDHCWSDLSVQDWNTNLQLSTSDSGSGSGLQSESGNTGNTMNESTAMEMDDVEDEELRKALAMSMMEDMEDNQDTVQSQQSPVIPTVYTEDGWVVRSCFDDAFYGGHCLLFESTTNTVSGKGDNNVFIYPLHSIAQDEYIGGVSVISCSFAVKTKEKECNLYLVMDVVDERNVSHRVTCQDAKDGNGILGVCGHSQKVYGNGWVFHIFDFKINNTNDGNQEKKFKIKGISACIGMKGKVNVSNKKKILLGFVSVGVSCASMRMDMSADDSDEKEVEGMLITRTMTVNEHGELDNIIKMDWSNAGLKRFDHQEYTMMNVYMVECTRNIEDKVTGKWMSSMEMKGIISSRVVRNMEWMVGVRFGKKQVMLNSSLMATILNKWTKKKEESKSTGSSVKCLLFGVSDLTFGVTPSSMWCVVKMKQICH